MSPLFLGTGYRTLFCLQTVLVDLSPIQYLSVWWPPGHNRPCGLFDVCMGNSCLRPDHNLGPQPRQALQFAVVYMDLELGHIKDMQQMSLPRLILQPLFCSGRVTTTIQHNQRVNS